MFNLPYHMISYILYHIVYMIQCLSIDPELSMRATVYHTFVAFDLGYCFWDLEKSIKSTKME